jgi:hypothetical protein
MTAPRKLTAELEAMIDGVPSPPEEPPTPISPDDYGHTDPAGKVVEIESRFRLIPFDKLSPSTQPAYLVKGLLPRAGLVVVWGPPKCGKSFWVTDVMLHVALGWIYRGRKVHRGPVVYCALEGAEGHGRRAEAFRMRRLAENHEPVPFYLVPARMSLVKDHAALISAIRLELGDKKPVAIVLDTLNRSIDGSESDDKDMGNYIRAADAVKEAFDCAVVVVHHCGVEGSRPRGHTSLTGAVDAQLAVKRDASGNIVVTVEWLKDGAEGETIVSRLDMVEVGTDSDGDPITSCVVEAVEGGEAQQPTTRKLSDRQSLALGALAECASTPAAAGLGLPAGTRMVKSEEWRSEILARGVLDRDAKNPRQDWKRLRQELAARHLIGERDGMVWRA